MPIEVEHDGEKIEVFTKEEVEQQIQQTKEEVEETLKETAEANQAELDRVNAELEKEKGKDKNFGILRKTKEELEKEKSELQTRLDTVASEVKEIKDNKLNEKHNAFLSKRGVDDNVKFVERFKFHFQKVGAGVKVDAPEFEEAMTNAFILAANDGQVPDEVRQSAVHRDNYIYHNTNKTNKESDTSKEIGNDLNLSEEDKKKYGGGSTKLF